MKFENINAGYTGEQFEREFLATIFCGWNGAEWVRKDSVEKNEIVEEWVRSNLCNVDLKDWRRSNFEQRKNYIIDWIKVNQPENWNPSNPLHFKEERGAKGELLVDNKISSDLHSAVAEGLSLEDYDALKFYTATHTPADTLYGIDCFFEYEGIILTIDLTINDSKIESGTGVEKADWIVTLKDISDAQSIEAIGKKIANAIKFEIRKLEQRKNKAA